ncbi:MAG: 5-formyltetrahydrofolate cyclo-ligase [Thermodesulfobacteriota bacterium]|nr:5-formyltetrahydrofolate cyclo-ligase [Thermodesulfobacteriota bacterium]
MHSKSEIRKAALERRKDFGRGERAFWEKAIQDYIAEASVFKRANVVALYAPIRGEVDILPLWHAHDKVMVFPRVEGDTLRFYPVRVKDDLSKGSFGILEPAPSAYQRWIEVNDIGLILVPGLVFDRAGFRVGYGKGFYDRLLNLYPDVVTMGVCFDEFFVERLSVDSWDARVNFIATQSGIFKSEGEVIK